MACTVVCTYHIQVWSIALFICPMAFQSHLSDKPTTPHFLCFIDSTMGLGGEKTLCNMNYYTIKSLFYCCLGEECRTFYYAILSDSTGIESSVTFDETEQGLFCYVYKTNSIVRIKNLSSKESLSEFRNGDKIEFIKCNNE